jgi:hypothetical protein
MVQLSINLEPFGGSESTSSAAFGQERTSWPSNALFLYPQPPFLSCPYLPTIGPSIQQVHDPPSLKGQLPQAGPHTEDKKGSPPSLLPSLTHSLTYSLSLSLSLSVQQRWLGEEAVQWLLLQRCCACCCSTLRWLMQPSTRLEMLAVGLLTLLAGPRESAFVPVTYLVSVFYISPLYFFIYLRIMEVQFIIKFV